MLYREIIAVCSQIHTKHINTLCGQNVELLNVKLAVYKVTTRFLVYFLVCLVAEQFACCKTSCRCRYCRHISPTFPIRQQDSQCSLTSH